MDFTACIAELRGVEFVKELTTQKVMQILAGLRKHLKLGGADVAEKEREIFAALATVLNVARANMYHDLVANLLGQKELTCPPHDVDKGALKDVLLAIGGVKAGELQVLLPVGSPYRAILVKDKDAYSALMSSLLYNKNDAVAQELKSFEVLRRRWESAVRKSVRAWNMAVQTSRDAYECIAAELKKMKK